MFTRDDCTFTHIRPHRVTGWVGWGLGGATLSVRAVDKMIDIPSRMDGTDQWCMAMGLLMAYFH